MGDLSAHFSRWEFQCKHGGKPKECPLYGEAPDDELVQVLERIREVAGGRPLPIVSGFRCVWWNRQVSGARRSQHLRRRAADIPRGSVTVDQAKACGARGIGSSGIWAVHVDVRPGRRVARWSY